MYEELFDGWEESVIKKLEVELLYSTVAFLKNGTFYKKELTKQIESDCLREMEFESTSIYVCNYLEQNL